MKYEKLNRLILIFIIITFYILYIINEKEVLCESNIKHFLPQLKEIVYKQLSLLIRQDDFIMQYNTKFYQDCILKKEFIKIFVENVDWANLLQNKHEKDILYIKNQIIDKFYIYIEEEQLKYNIKVLKNMLMNCLEKVPLLLEQYSDFIKHVDDADIKIRTPGFEQHLKDYKYKIIQDFIKEGLEFKISLDENENAIIISLSWNTIILYYTKI